MRRVVMMLFVMALVLSIGVSVDARMKLGPKVGVAITSLGGDALEEFDSKTTLDFGAFVQIPLGENSPIVFQPELMYVMKGGKIEAEGAELSYNFDYFEIPLLVKFNIPVEGNLTPNLFAGPVVGLLTSAKVKMEYEGEEAEEDIKEYFKSTDFSLAFGGGVDIVMGTSGTLTFDIRYELGLTNTLDDDGEAEIKHNAFMFNVGWGFDI